MVEVETVGAMSRFFCYDVCAARAPNELVLVGKTEAGATRFVRVAVAQHSFRVAPDGDAEACNMRAYDRHGEGRDVRVRETVDASAGAFSRSLGALAYDTAPLETALFRSPLCGPTWLRFSGAAASASAPASALDFDEPPGAPVPLDALEAAGDAPPPPRWSILAIEPLDDDETRFETVFATADAFDAPWARQRARTMTASELRTHLAAQAPDVVACYDARRTRAALGATWRHAHMRRHDAAARSPSTVAAARSGDGYLWAEARTLAKQLSASAQPLDRERLRESLGGGAQAWITLVERTRALRISFETARIAGALWRFALEAQRLVVSECMLARAHIRFNYVLPHAAAPQSDASIQGARVLDAKVGAHHPVVVHLDVASMYPSAVRERAICYDESVPAGGARMLPSLMAQLIEARRGAPRGSAESEALKLCANALFGCTGAPAFRFYSPRMANAITRAGREILTELEAIAAAWCAGGSEARCIVAGDTDALMVRVESREAADDLAQTCERAFEERFRHVRVRVDALYARVVVVSAKSYVARTLDGAVRACGCAPQRGDARAVAALIDEANAAAAADDTATLEALLAAAAARIGAAPLAHLVCARKLGQPLDAYVGDAQPHVVAARTAAARYAVGEHVPFVALLVNGAPSYVLPRAASGANAATAVSTPALDFYVARALSATRPLLRALHLVAAPVRAPRYAHVAAAARVLGAPLTARLLGAYSTRPPDTPERTGAWPVEAATTTGDSLAEAVAALEGRVRTLLARVDHARNVGASAHEWVQAHALVSAFAAAHGGGAAVEEAAEAVRVKIQQRVGAIVNFS
jgi:hypothetical protein